MRHFISLFCCCDYWSRMVLLSAAERREMVHFLDQIEDCIDRFSREADNITNLDNLLLEAETLLNDVILVSDLMPPEDGDLLIQCISDIYLWLEEKVRVHRRGRGRGRPQIEITEDQLMYFNFLQVT